MIWAKLALVAVLMGGGGFVWNHLSTLEAENTLLRVGQAALKRTLREQREQQVKVAQQWEVTQKALQSAENGRISAEKTVKTLHLRQKEAIKRDKLAKKWADMRVPDSIFSLWVRQSAPGGGTDRGHTVAGVVAARADVPAGGRAAAPGAD